jgi:ubiquinone/menaquinone biosynthesis C-methylase UbiE
VSRVSFDDVAVAYDEFMGRWTRRFAPGLIRAAGIAAGQRVLEVASGTGESTLLLAAAVGPQGFGLATDISLPLLRRASTKIARRPIRLVAGDGQGLACRGGTFDRVVCQFGLHFLPDPVAGVREARRVLRAGGRFAALLWSAPERVPWYAVLARELLQHFPGRRDNLFAAEPLGDRARLGGVLRDGGLADVRVEAETHLMTFTSFDAYWRHVESGAIRFGLMLRELSPPVVADVRERVRARLAVYAQGGRLRLPAEALIAVGSA